MLFAMPLLRMLRRPFRAARESGRSGRVGDLRAGRYGSVRCCGTKMVEWQELHTALHLVIQTSCAVVSSKSLAYSAVCLVESHDEYANKTNKIDLTKQGFLEFPVVLPSDWLIK